MCVFKRTKGWGDITLSMSKRERSKKINVGGEVKIDVGKSNLKSLYKEQMRSTDRQQSGN